jgi:hypothetical protein
MLGWGECQTEHRHVQQSIATIATMGIDIGKNSFHVVGLDQPIVLRQKWSLAGRPVYPGYLPTLLQHTSRQRW